MACSPFDCERCGQRHTKCEGHVAICPTCGRPPISDQEARRRAKQGLPCATCGALPTERPCGANPRYFQSVCIKHGGNASQTLARDRRAEQLRQAEVACTKLGVPIETDPITSLTNRLWETEGDLLFYRQRVQELGLDITEIEDGGKVGGTKTVLRVLVQAYHDAEERNAKLSLECAKLGIESKRLELDQARAVAVFTGVSEALKAMGLGDRLEEFRHAFAAAIRHGPVSLGAG